VSAPKEKLYRDHVSLSASGSSKWLNCTPSAKLETKIEESTDSVYSIEGTIAHSLADIHLRFFNNEIDEKTHAKEIKKIQSHAMYSQEMEHEVQKYVDIIKEMYHDALGQKSDVELFIEEKFEFSNFVRNVYCKIDAALVADGNVSIIDMKYGVGNKILAESNSQLMLYALGVLDKYDMLYDISSFHLTIIQPRLDHTSTFYITVEDLLAWGESHVLPRAEMAYAGKGDKCVGDWCKFCKAAPLCNALYKESLAVSKHDFKDPDLIDDDTLFELSKQLPILKDWANSVQKYILSRAINGHQWPGYKLVEGKSNRRWKSEADVIDTLKSLYVDKPESYTNVRVKSITEIERLTGKKDFSSHFSHLLEKPQGKISLVHSSDPRRAINSFEKAKEYFED